MITYIDGVPCIVLPVSASDVDVLQALDQAWARIRQQDARIPAVVFDLTPGKGSSCASVGWDQPHPVLSVNLMPDGSKATGADIVELLLHLAAHSVAIPISGTEGRHHGFSYREEARGLGLDVGAARTGLGMTSLSMAASAAYAPEILALDKALKAWTPTTVAKSDRSSRNGIVAECSCVPSRKIRMRSETSFSLGEITCSICGEPFQVTGA